MIRLLLSLACVLTIASCAVESELQPARGVATTATLAAPPATTVVLVASASADCQRATKATLTPDCILANPDEQDRVGMACALHPSVALQADTVRISYGFASSPECGERPGLFINSRLMVSGGCVLGRPFTVVAYCSECRRVRAEWERAQALRR